MRTLSVAGSKGPVVYVVSTSRPFVDSLAYALKGCVVVEGAATLPAAAGLQRADLVVLDLAHVPSTIAPYQVTALARARSLWAVLGTAPIMPLWIGALRDEHLRVLIGGEDAAFRRLVTALRETIAEPNGNEIATLVMRAHPCLQPIAHLVQLICQRPWTVRRPRDLAAAVGHHVALLRAQCRALGFRRIEHLIIAVRMLSLEALARTRGMTLSAARQLIGIPDRSNARRQMHRARRTSREAFRSLASEQLGWRS